MAGRGPLPDPDALRSNKEGEWATVEWEGDDSWDLFIESDAIPDPPAALWSGDVEGLGRRAYQAWVGVWSGPFRGELLPQHMPELELLCDAHFYAQNAAVEDRPKWLVQARLLGAGFGMNPGEVRRQRVKVAKPRQKPAAAVAAGGKPKDDGRRKRAANTVKVQE